MKGKEKKVVDFMTSTSKGNTLGTKQVKPMY